MCSLDSERREGEVAERGMFGLSTNSDNVNGEVTSIYSL